MDLNTIEWGAPGPRALLLHGLTSTAATWAPIAEGLAAAGWQVTAVDLRGHGHSPGSDRYALSDLAGDLDGGWDLVVGHSLGALVAAHAAQQDPAFAREVVLIDPPVRISEEQLDAVRADLHHELESTVEETRALNPLWSERDARLKVEATASCRPEVVDAVLRDNAPWDHVHLLEGIDPLVIAGHPERGGIFPPALAPARFLLVEHAGHSVQRDDPALVLETLVRAAHQ